MSAEFIVVAALAVWWTFAVVVWMTLALGDWINGKKDMLAAIGMAAAWPLTAAIAIPMLIYSAVVSSADRIRVDLRNRNLLREFEGWLREREAGKVLPKSDNEDGE